MRGRCGVSSIDGVDDGQNTSERAAMLPLQKTFALAGLSHTEKLFINS